MNTAIWRSLLWKEWREHRWKLAALVVVVIGLHVWALDATEPGPDHYVLPLMMTLTVVVPIGSFFIAIGLAASEQSQRTASFLRSQPLNLRWVAAIKLVVGVATIVATLAVAVLATRGMTAWMAAMDWRPSARSMGNIETLQSLNFSLYAALLTLGVGASLILWIAAPAVNSRSEVRAGAIGLIVVVACWTAFVWGLYLYSGDNNLTHLGPMGKHVTACLAAMLPGGIIVGAELLGHGSVGVSSATYLLAHYFATHVPLAWWYITRFGRTGDHERARLNDAAPLVAPAPAWLGPARRSPLTALLWKHTRECAPIVLAGAVGAVGIAITVVCVEYQHDRAMSLLELTSGSVLMGFMTLGCCAGLVCGAGVLTSELEPRLFTFWRTRPISIDLWFAIAFLGGLALLLVVFGVPIAVAYQLAIPEDSSFEPPLSLILAILVLSYVSGAFTASFVRNAVYASLLGLGVMAFAFAGVMHTLTRVKDEWVDIPEASLGVATLAVSAVLGVAAWVCVRNDWSLRLS